MRIKNWIKPSRTFPTFHLPDLCRMVRKVSSCFFGSDFSFELVKERVVCAATMGCYTMSAKISLRLRADVIGWERRLHSWRYGCAMMHVSCLLHRLELSSDRCHVRWSISSHEMSGTSSLWVVSRLELMSICYRSVDVEVISKTAFTLLSSLAISAVVFQ